MQSADKVYKIDENTSSLLPSHIAAIFAKDLINFQFNKPGIIGKY